VLQCECLAAWVCCSVIWIRSLVCTISEGSVYVLRYSITTHCNTLQHTATHCNILQHSRKYAIWICGFVSTISEGVFVCIQMLSYSTLQHTIMHFNALQHTATHCNTLQHTATHCNTLQQRGADLIWIRCLGSVCVLRGSVTVRCSTLQHDTKQKRLWGGYD